MNRRTITMATQIAFIKLWSAPREMYTCSFTCRLDDKGIRGDTCWGGVKTSLMSNHLNKTKKQKTVICKWNQSVRLPLWVWHGKCGKPHLCSFQRAVGTPFSCKAFEKPFQWQNPSRCLVLPPSPTCTQTFFFSTAMHAFPGQCKPLFIRIPAPGRHYTPSSFATMGAFLSPPRPPLFPAESPRASFFVDTFNKTSQLLPWLIIESEGQCHVLRYKGQSNANVSSTCRAMMVKFQRIPVGNW